MKINHVYPDVTHSNMLWLLLKSQTRLNILQDPSIFYTQMKEITLEFDEKSLFMLDGELYHLLSPLTIKHHNKSIEVIGI